MKKLLGILVLGLLFIFASNSPEAKAEDFKLTKITENLKSPWSLSFINRNVVWFISATLDFKAYFFHLFLFLVSSFMLSPYSLIFSCSSC